MKLVDITELFFHELRAKGVEQTWMSGPSAEPGPCRTEYVSGIPVLVPPNFGPGTARRLLTRAAYWLLELLFMIRQCRNRPDGILIRDKYWGAILGLIAARACGCKFMMWLSYPYPEHDAEIAESEAGWRRYFARVRAAVGTVVLYRIAMRRADHCFVQSEQMKSDLLKWGIRPDRMTAVPMGVAKRLFDEIETGGPLSEPPVVLYLGTMASVRRLEILVDAFAIVASLHPNVRFEFVGDGPSPGDRRRLEDRVNRAGISHVVRFTGQLPMSEALGHVARASVCVSPFRTTPVLRVASPTKFMEYLSFAKPTVGNRHPEHSFIAEQSDGALVVDWSARAFAEAIVWCLDNPEQAREMGRRGRDWIGRYRTYDRIASQVHPELTRVLCEARA